MSDICKNVIKFPYSKSLTYFVFLISVSIFSFFTFGEVYAQNIFSVFSLFVSIFLVLILVLFFSIVFAYRELYGVTVPLLVNVSPKGRVYWWFRFIKVLCTSILPMVVLILPYGIVVYFLYDVSFVSIISSLFLMVLSALLIAYIGFLLVILTYILTKLVKPPNRAQFWRVILSVVSGSVIFIMLVPVELGIFTSLKHDYSILNFLYPNQNIPLLGLFIVYMFEWIAADNFNNLLHMLFLQGALLTCFILFYMLLVKHINYDFRACIFIQSRTQSSVWSKKPLNSRWLENNFMLIQAEILKFLRDARHLIKLVLVFFIATIVSVIIYQIIMFFDLKQQSLWGMIAVIFVSSIACIITTKNIVASGYVEDTYWHRVIESTPVSRRWYFNGRVIVAVLVNLISSFSFLVFLWILGLTTILTIEKIIFLLIICFFTTSYIAIYYISNKHSHTRLLVFTVIVYFLLSSVFLLVKQNFDTWLSITMFILSSSFLFVLFYFFYGKDRHPDSDHLSAGTYW